MRVMIIAVAAALVGCTPTPYLRWNTEPPAPQLQGRVVLRDVVNKRPPKKGANEPENVGNIRSGFGIPYAIRIDGSGTQAEGPIEPRTLPQALGELVTAGIQHAGVGMGMPADPQATSLLFVEVLEFWCDGYMGYGATVTLDLALVDPRTQALRAKVPVHQEGHGGNCREAYANALNVVQAEIASAFSRPDVRAAALGGGAPPPPGYPPPVAAPPVAGAPPSAVGSCPTGKMVGPDTSGYCCWPGQVFAASRNGCVGVPTSCPPGMHVAGEQCAP